MPIATISRQLQTGKLSIRTGVLVGEEMVQLFRILGHDVAVVSVMEDYEKGEVSERVCRERCLKERECIPCSSALTSDGEVESGEG